MPKSIDLVILIELEKYGIRDKRARALMLSIRGALERAGYAIVVDEAQALERGREVKLHD